MFEKIKRIFINGLITFLPIAVTTYILISCINLVESILGNLLRTLLPEGYYLPGFGFIATIILIFIFGLLVTNLITATVVKKIQNKMTEIPIIKAVYSPLRDLINLFSSGSSKNQSPQKVVLVHFNPDMSLLGLITRENYEDLKFRPDLIQDRVAVLVLMSYGIGGYTILVNKKNIEPVEMTVEAAMRLSVTGWIKKNDEY